MTESKSIQLGEFTYEVGLSLASEALRAGSACISALGQSASLTGLLGNSELLLLVCSTFAPYTQVKAPDGKSYTLSRVFDAHFQGRLGDLLIWASVAAEVNLASFFAVVPVLVEKAAALAAATKAASEFQKTAKTPG